jgi:hypothetical protein
MSIDITKMLDDAMDQKATNSKISQNFTNAVTDEAIIEGLNDRLSRHSHINNNVMHIFAVCLITLATLMIVGYCRLEDKISTESHAFNERFDSLQHLNNQRLDSLQQSIKQELDENNRHNSQRIDSIIDTERANISSSLIKHDAKITSK